MARAPIVPTNLADPGGIDRAERRAIKDFSARIRLIRAAYLDLLDRINFNAIEVNVTRYEFLTLPEVLGQMLSETGDLVDQILLEGGERSLWFSVGYVIPAYEQGTAQSWRNLGVQSTEYAAVRPALANVLFSEPYQRRLGLVRAREFELMKGLSGTVKQQMAQTLTAGLAQGIGPREIAKNLTAQAGVEDRRAERIARTEIGTALRTARMDEAQDAATRLGAQIKLMHLSALSPTTRLTHAQRHGKLYTIQVEREWFGEGANSINCKCSTTEVLVDDKGEPLSRGLIDRTARARVAWEERQTAE